MRDVSLIYDKMITSYAAEARQRRGETGEKPQGKARGRRKKTMETTITIDKM